MRTDPRVRVMERTNLRALRLPDIGGRPVDLVTLDLSFISVLKVMDAVGGWGRRERLVLTVLDVVGGRARRWAGQEGRLAMRAGHANAACCCCNTGIAVCPMSNSTTTRSRWPTMRTPRVEPS